MAGDRHNVHITQHSPVSATILVNGRAIQDAVRAYTITAEVGQGTTVGLSLIPRAFTFDGEAIIDVTPLTRDLLIRLGWTPPVVDVATGTPGPLGVAQPMKEAGEPIENLWRPCPGPPECTEISWWHDVHINADWNGERWVPRDAVRYDDNTLVKVREALRQEGVAEENLDAMINAIMNAGIVFRERA